jgi:hypothetical protein
MGCSAVGCGRLGRLGGLGGCRGAPTGQQQVVGLQRRRRPGVLRPIAGTDGLVVVTYQADPSSPDADALARLL